MIVVKQSSSFVSDAKWLVRAHVIHIELKGYEKEIVYIAPQLEFEHNSFTGKKTTMYANLLKQP